jgi:zinc finger protein
MQELGVSFDVSIETERDLNRQVVKSDYATLKVPEIDLEIPPNSQKGGTYSALKWKSRGNLDRMLTAE